MAKITEFLITCSYNKLYYRILTQIQKQNNEKYKYNIKLNHFEQINKLSK